MMGPWMMYGWGGGFNWLAPIFIWIFFIFFIVIIVRLIVGKSHDSDDSSEEKTPLDILKERYAKGEITKKDFDQMKKDLSA